MKMERTAMVSGCVVGFIRGLTKSKFLFLLSKD